MILLDVEFQAEREFKIRIPRCWPGQVGIRTDGGDATVADALRYFLQLCREQNVVPPEDPWSSLVKVACDASRAKGSDMLPETLLIRDIAPFGYRNNQTMLWTQPG